jgi:peptide/nickel transport system permease protein
MRRGRLMSADAVAVVSRPRRRALPASLWVGALVVALVVVAALAAPLIAPYPYDEMHFGDRLKAPSRAYWLGTDEFGRDVLSRTLLGGRLSLVIGLGATAVCMTLGVPIGLVAGYARGRTDELIMRAMDVIMSFPPILLGLLILAVTPPSIWKTTAAVGLVYVPAIVRITRSVTLGLAGEEFVQAARARGEGPLYILGAEILPNAWPPIIVEASLRVTFAILLGAALSFLGLGAQPPSSDWGLMIGEARAFVDSAPWVAMAPGLAMCLTVVGVNLLGDGLREILDPRIARARTA